MVRRYFAASLALFGFSLLSESTTAQVNRWMPSGPSATVRALEIDRSTGTLFAATADGIYRSGDHGSTWTLVNSKLREMYCLASHSGAATTLYAGGRESSEGWIPAVFRSMDSGATWSRLGGTLPTGPVILLLADPDQPILYAFVHDWGLFKSLDSGSTWTRIGKGVVASVLSLAIDPHDGRRLWVGDDRGRVSRSDDGGLTWSTGTGLSGHPVTDLSLDPGDPAKIYAATYHGGVFRSENSGADWVQASVGLESWTVNAVEVDPHEPGVIYAGTDGDASLCCSAPPPTGGVYRSADGGATWTSFNAGLPPGAGIREFAVDATGTYVFALLGDGAGLFAYQLIASRAPIVRGPVRRMNPIVSPRTE